MARRKHVPIRTCVACRQTAGKRALIRIVRSPEGVQVDPRGKLPGRGAYLHPARKCWERALATRALDRALRTTLSSQERAELETYAATLPQELEDPEDATST